MRICSFSLWCAALLAAGSIAACTSSENQTVGTSATSPGTATQDTEAAAAGDRLRARMALSGSPIVSADGKFIIVAVDLSNDGSATWVGTGLNPIKLGAHSVDAKGNVINNDLARGVLPGPVAPNGHVLLSISLPLSETVGYSAQIIPVQENVGWFDKWGTKPLVVGPFNVCSDNTKGSVCDADGKALSVGNSN